MYKILNTLLFIFLSHFCLHSQSLKTSNDILLIDTIIDGSHIRIDILPSGTSSSVYLHIRHNNLENTLKIDNYYYDLETHSELLFINSEKQIVNTWIAKTKSLIVFVLPYYPAIGLYAYRIENNKIKFVTMPENLPIYSDYYFFAKFDSDIITSCYQPSAKNINGATMWKLSKKDKFKKFKSTAYDSYLAIDSTKFINTLNNIYNKCTNK